jgi:hypothetical protein
MIAQRQDLMPARTQHLTQDLIHTAWTALCGPPAALDAVRFTGDGGLPSTFAVSDLAASTIAVAALAIAELARACGGPAPGVVVNRRLASFWFKESIRPSGWRLPPRWGPLAGDFRASDGWIRLHTNAPHHHAVAARILDGPRDKAEAASAVARWRAHDLEAAIVAAGGCAAEMRSTRAWTEHPQGRAVAAEPLVHFLSSGHAADRDWAGSASRPLAGLRVLDLTRVLAGPVASRVLAGFGATVLRIDPSSWNEPGTVPEVTLGKRCARLDLKTAEGRRIFETLLASADVFLNGYRSDALERLGYGDDARRALAPGLVDVRLDAYGWSGPWATRRGYDSLVQMSSGIAEAGMRWKTADAPVPLPAQALDHATGYLTAAAAIRGLTLRLTAGHGTQARLSLARTAKLLIDCGENHEVPPLAPETPADIAPDIEHTSWGDARRLMPPVAIGGIPMRWDLPATDLGSAPPAWWT